MGACPKCARPAWKSHGGMGGGIMPDSETNCVRRDGRDCRTAAAGVAADRARIAQAIRDVFSEPVGGPGETLRDRLLRVVEGG